MDIATDKALEPKPVLFAGLWRMHGLLACVGGVLIGVTGPVLLVSWNRKFQSIAFELEGAAPFGDAPTPLYALFHTLDLGVTALIGCGPLALFFAVILFYLLRNLKANERGDRAQVVWSGALSGAALSLMNVPAWLVTILIQTPNKVHAFLLTLLLFLVAGGTAGLWISWQAWRVHHPDAPLLPRYSLKTLLILVFAWGMLLAIFKPI